MPTWRAPSWMYLVATVFIMTFLFNMRQEFWGPENAGWVPGPNFFEVATVLPGSAMERAGAQPGDFLETADGYPLDGRASWSLARAYFERGRPIHNASAGDTCCFWTPPAAQRSSCRAHAGDRGSCGGVSKLGMGR